MSSVSIFPLSLAFLIRLYCPTRGGISIIYHQCLAAVNHLTNVLQSWENMRFFNTIQKKHQPNPLEFAILNSPTQPAIQSSFMQQYNQLFFSHTLTKLLNIIYNSGALRTGSYCTSARPVFNREFNYRVGIARRSRALPLKTTW